MWNIILKAAFIILLTFFLIPRDKNFKLKEYYFSNLTNWIHAVLLFFVFFICIVSLANFSFFSETIYSLLFPSTPSIKEVSEEVTQKELASIVDTVYTVLLTTLFILVGPVVYESITGLIIRFKYGIPLILSCVLYSLLIILCGAPFTIWIAFLLIYLLLGFSYVNEVRKGSNQILNAIITKNMTSVVDLEEKAYHNVVSKSVIFFGLLYLSILITVLISFLSH